MHDQLNFFQPENTRSFSNHDLQYLLALKSIDGLGDRTILKLLRSFKSTKEIFAANGNLLNRAGLNAQITKSILDFDFESLVPIWEWADRSNHSIIPFGSSLYPALLQNITNAPLLLFTSGNSEILTSPQIAVVGTRSPSVQGIEITKSLCEALSHQGLTLTSGLATGIDGQAHIAALESGGLTIGVAATSLDTVSPARHKALAKAISESGCLVSERLPYSKTDKGAFPRRNRIIAGLSLGTLVIEAAKNSGSLITADFALNFGREVFAVPSSIHNPLAKGCHSLIKQGAKLTETIDDILPELSWNQHKLANNSLSPWLQNFQRKGSNSTLQGMHELASNQHRSSSLSDEDSHFLKLIDYQTTSIDSIVSRSQLTVEAVTNKLLQLELLGFVVNGVGGYTRI